MNKLSRLTRNSLIIAFFFLIDKILAFVRTGIISRQYSGSVELLDTFNAANNLPDVLFALIQFFWIDDCGRFDLAHHAVII